MNLRYPLTVAVFASVAVISCRESDQLTSPAGNARIEVTSDPDGAAVFLAGRNTGKVTPALLLDLSLGGHEILVRKDHDNVTYGFRAEVDVKGDSLHRVHGPLTVRCVSEACWTQNQRYHTINSLRLATNPNGALFFRDATGRGLFWPAGTANEYVAIGMPMVAALAGTRDTLALGIYDIGYMAGRPAPQVNQTADRYSLRQSFWVLPPFEIISNFAPTIRGIEVDEELIGTSAANDVAFVKLTFRNITNRSSYHAMDPIVPIAGVTFNSVYLGFALDPDIGTATDDIVTYQPSLDMVFAYDMDFQEPTFTAANSSQPGLIGLRLLEAPMGASARLNAWPGDVDWRAGLGDGGELFGYRLIAGLTTPLTPDMAGAHVGFMPSVPDDYRMSVAAGPLTLAPGAEASITVAVILAAPMAGTYTSGQRVQPDNPNTSGRTIERIAAGLLDKARGLVVPN